MATPDNGHRWTIKKEVSLGDLIAFGMAFVSVVYAYSTLDRRVAVIEVTIGSQRETDKRQDDDSIRSQDNIQRQLAAINAKLDRLIEAKR